MAKRDDDHSMAEDYLTQIKWRGEHPYGKTRPPEPDWKYMPVNATHSSVPSGIGTIFIVLFLIILGVLLYLAIFKQMGGAIFGSVLLIIFGSIIFLAVRDASKSKNNDED
jgi:hypothetical protein